MKMLTASCKEVRHRHIWVDGGTYGRCLSNGKWKGFDRDICQTHHHSMTDETECIKS
jgi:hypothetical protein